MLSNILAPLISLFVDRIVSDVKEENIINDYTKASPVKIIDPNYYALAAPILNNIKHQSVIQTILSGLTPGFIYVDCPENPEAAFAQFKHRTFLSGKCNLVDHKDFRQFILDEMFDNCRTADVPLIRLSASNPAWITFTANCLAAEKPILTDYQCYLYECSSPIDEIVIPEGFVLQPVDEALLLQDFSGKAQLLEEICSERESIEAFLAQSFGIAAFHENKLAGWCLSEYNYKNQCEVGIATKPQFQRQGLAKVMTKNFLNQAYHHGINRILWHCYKSNIGSRKTALSAGFSLYKEEQVLIQYIDQGLHLAVHGNIAFNKEKYSEALAWFEKSLSFKTHLVWVVWNAACAAVHTGQFDRAFDYLNQALTFGFSDLDKLVQSDHLTPLKNDPRWGNLITRLTQELPS
jgi:RimJ/RimL family protein N-acetyltransferase